jgi:hypothetical protein
MFFANVGLLGKNTVWIPINIFTAMRTTDLMFLAL